MESKLSSLLELNNQRYNDFTQRPFFQMIASEDLKNPNLREEFFNYMQIFADNFQTMLFARQATCRDEKFYPTFLQHLKEEIGHDDLLRNRKNPQKKWDPILAGISSWFIYQMMILDNAEKTAVMHLVLEVAGDYYHSYGNRMLSSYINSDYYETHEEHDENHAEMGVALLEGYTEATYKRMYTLINESWDMIIAMIDRVHQIIQEIKNKQAHSQSLEDKAIEDYMQ